MEETALGTAVEVILTRYIEHREFLTIRGRILRKAVGGIGIV